MIVWQIAIVGTYIVSQKRDNNLTNFMNTAANDFLFGGVQNNLQNAQSAGRYDEALELWTKGNRIVVTESGNTGIGDEAVVASTTTTTTTTTSVTTTSYTTYTTTTCC